ncbi:MAG: cytochrome c [Gemmatimonadaceae bacterium]|nr:cytochrome c [Gemmatimonadaceae bacterium]
MNRLTTSFAAITFAVLSSRLSAQAPDGKPLYLKHCRSCHGTTGAPTNQAKREHPDIRALDAEFLSKLSQDSLIAVITNGFEKGDEMKPFKKKMTPQEIEAVARYVKEVLGAPKPK